MREQVSRLPNWFFALLLTAFLSWIIFLFRAAIPPLLVSALLAYLLNPLVSLLTDRSPFSRRSIVAMVYVLFLLALVFFSIYLVPLIARQANTLATAFQMSLEELPLALQGVEQMLGVNLPVEQFLGDLRSALYQVFSPNQAFRVVLAATNNIVWVLVIIFLSYYLLQDWSQLRDWFFGFFEGEQEVDARNLHRELKKVWQAYLRGQFSLMLIVGFASGLGAALLGLPGAVLLGLLAGFLNLIPSLGPAAAMLAAAAIAWTRGSATIDAGGLTLTLLIVLIFGGIQIVENTILQPRVLGRRMNLHPAIVLVTVVSAFAILGALAALLAVPVLASLDVFIRYWRLRSTHQDPWAQDLESSST